MGMDWAWSPLGISILWVVLHSADYLLTIAAARTYAEGDLRSRIDLGGRSLELNPVFQRAVDRGAWASRRFVVSLVGTGGALLAVFSFLDAVPAEVSSPLRFAPELFAGVLVVTRLVVITGHLQNLALFRRMLRHPAAAGVVLRYDRGTIFTAKRWSYAQPVALCTLGLLLSGRPFFGGGVVGMLGLALATSIWQRVEERRGGSRPSAPPPGPEEETGSSVPRQSW